LLFAFFSGSYHQYDGMILPPQKPKSWFSKWNPWGEKIPDLPAHRINQDQCLDFFLQEYERTLFTSKLVDTSFQEIISNILHLYEQLECQQLCRDDRRSSSDVRIVPKFKEVCWEIIISTGGNFILVGLSTLIRCSY